EAGGMAKALEPVLAEHRPKGALWGWLAVPGVGHAFAGQEVLAMPILDAAVRLRYPADGDVRKGPVKLKSVALESGWVADNTTWKSGLTTITPAKKFKGDVAKSSWLLNEDIAFIYRAYATHDRPLKITSPSSMSAKREVFDAGSAVTIRVDDSKFTDWTKLELYDGAAKVGELTKGKAEFTVKGLKAGYHAFSVLGTDGKGDIRPSNPVLVVVRKPAESTAGRAAIVEVVATFEGNKGPGFKAAANVMGAVGPNHIVDFTVAGFTVHDKATGKVLRHLGQREFWNKVEPPNSIDPEKANDPWMVYDPLSQRWFATMAANDNESFLAVSTSSDPMKAWKGVKLPLPRIDPGIKIGVDRHGLYICSANGSSDMKEALSCCVIPKADALAPEGPALSRAQTFPKLIYAAVPAVDLDPNKAADAPAVLLNNEFGGPTCGKLFLYKITWSGQKASLSAAQEIALSKAYQVPRMEGIQPPPGIKLLQAGGRRNNCAFVQGGSVFGCNGAQRTPDSRPGILWYEVRIRDGALLQEGFVDDPNCDYLYPSMAVDSKGNIGIGCTRTSEKEFPSVCVMMHAAGDPAGTMRAPVLAVKGTTYFRYAGVTAKNLSNYCPTCSDPSAADRLCTYQGYANSTTDRQWCTAWAAFRMEAAEKAPAPELTTIPVGAGSRPQAIVSDPDGTVWFGTLTKVCKIGPDRKISEIPLPDNLKRPSTAPRATIV